MGKLQLNLIRSHATAYGQPLHPSKARMLLALRINVLAKGYSGISLENLKKMIAAFNGGLSQKLVGCSGDLAPLAHLALGLLGEGKMWSPSTGQADVIAALSLDVLKGTTRAYDPDIHKIRPHKGQIRSALRLRSLLHSDANPSQIAESHRNCGKVQDAYTLRCVPQVHGIVHDTIEFVREIITTEMNSATDNPLVFADREEIISGGNFHGEYPAKEGRNHVSENKVLCHPSSVDSIPTSCNQEDHVSMGGFAARKALTVVEHVEAVLAMELLAACQGIEFLKPLISTAPLNKVYQLVRTVSAPLVEDRFLQPEIEAIWECVQPHLKTLREMEELDPDALRIDAKTPTGIVMSERLDSPDNSCGISSDEHEQH
ncbi:unnamed protein product [Strongylus vulgaris]|uniref:Histidine ammonia-lyase n=1 Tax=Strongylus vulgaris TaxID=40348 RepID=A0A3P7L7M2_STRVU|nr:unnamed protein product [Strongylus vulgaris]